MRRDLALVLGGAHHVRDDVAALERMLGEPWPGFICAVNDIGVHWERRVDHWVSAHPALLAAWERERIRHLEKTWTTWGHKFPRLVDRVTRGISELGSSGLYAGRIMHEELGCRVVWAGCPMTPVPHFRESRVHAWGEPWKQWHRHYEVWEEHATEIRRWGRSMSGDMTLDAEALIRAGFQESQAREVDGMRVGSRYLIGAPTREWVHGESDKGDREDAASGLEGQVSAAT